MGTVPAVANVDEAIDIACAALGYLRRDGTTAGAAAVGATHDPAPAAGAAYHYGPKSRRKLEIGT